MTIIEAINRIDVLVPNTFEEREKIFWLSMLDALVKTDVIDRCEGGENVAFVEYNDATDPCVTLLVASPFDEMYLFWLEAKICYYIKEMEQYNNAIVMFNSAFDRFRKHYTRTHKPRRERLGFHL
jgi:hypothetical protein